MPFSEDIDMSRLFLSEDFKFDDFWKLNSVLTILVLTNNKK